VHRGDAGVDRAGPDRGGQPRRVAGIQLGAGDRHRPARRDPQVGGDPGRSRGVVAGDHQHADAGALRLRDRVQRLRPRRVEDAHGADVDQVLLEFAGRVGAEPVQHPLVLGVREPGIPHTQHAVGLRRQPVDARGDPLPLGGGERDGLLAVLDGDAARQQHVRGALGDDAQPGQRAVPADGRHQPPLGGERDLAAALERVRPGLEPGQLAGGNEERRLGRVAVHLHGVGVLGDDGVVGQGPAEQHQLDLRPQRRVAEVAGDGLRPTVRAVAGAGQPHLARRGQHPLHGHLVPGERPGLVGRDHRRAAEGLHRVQVLHHRTPGRHPLHADRQHHRQDRRQALRHGGHRERDTEQQDGDRVPQIVHAVQQRGDGHHQDGDRHHGDPEQPRHPGQVALQRTGLLDGGLQQFGDAADLGVHAGRGDHRPSGPLHDRRAAEHHVQPVAHPGGRGERGRVLRHRLALPGERGLQHPQPAAGDQPGVRADRVALGEFEQVAGDEVVRAHLMQPTVPDHGGGRGGQPGQRRDRVGRPLLLDEPDRGVGDQDRQDREHVDRPAVHALGHPGDQGDRHGDQQQVDQRVGELAEHPSPQRGRGSGAQHVRAVGDEPGCRLRGGEAGVDVGGQALGHITRRHERRVPVASSLRG